MKILMLFHEFDGKTNNGQQSTTLQINIEQHLMSKDKCTNNDLKILCIKLKIEQHEPN